MEEKKIYVNTKLNKLIEEGKKIDLKQIISDIKHKIGGMYFILLHTVF